MRSLTSNTREAGTGRFGFTQARELARRGMSCRPIVSTWRKPLVVTSAVLRALALEDHVGGDVVPCSTRPSAVAARPAVVQGQPHAGQEGLDGIGRHARRLGAPDLAAGGVVQGDVGEGAADIDGDGERGWINRAQST